MASSLASDELLLSCKAYQPEELESIQERLRNQLMQSVDRLLLVPVEPSSEQNGGYQYRICKEEWKQKRSCHQHNNRQQRTEQSSLEKAIAQAKICGTPRDYQQRLYEIAVQRNTIVHLGTGRGKTMVALMVIRHFAEKSMTTTETDTTSTTSSSSSRTRSTAFHRGQQTLFLVPSVALAQQQSHVMKANLPYSVGVAYNNIATSSKARAALLEKNIIVATHGSVRT